MQLSTELRTKTQVFPAHGSTTTGGETTGGETTGGETTGGVTGAVYPQHPSLRAPKYPPSVGQPEQ
ncbi:MAG: hypothetical protein EBT80_00790 [Chitinophagales bacterium]|nr:hypothetical protein [Chitinophagales bacterium]